LEFSKTGEGVKERVGTGVYSLEKKKLSAGRGGKEGARTVAGKSGGGGGRSTGRKDPKRSWAAKFLSKGEKDSILPCK